MINNKTICPNFFTNVMNDSAGVYKTCCLHIPYEENRVVGVSVDKKVEDFWNSEFMKTARKRSIEGKGIKGCEECYRSEENGGTSLRSDLIEIYKDTENYHERVDFAKENDGYLDQFPSSLELRVGNLCNLKCRMCQPQDSDLINKEYKEIISGNPEMTGILPIIDYEITDDLSTYIDDIRRNAGSIEKIRFSGGEPLINKSFYDLLDFLIEENYSNNIEFRLNTNLTKMTEDTLLKLNKFKRVSIDFSIDGLNNVYEYIRYPMKWGITKPRIDMVHKFMVEESNVIRMNANFTVQIYNIFDMGNLVRFFLEIGVLPILHMLQNPSYLNIKNAPDNLKEDLLKEITLLHDSLDDEGYKIKTDVKWVKERLIAIKNQLLMERDDKQIEIFKNFTLSLDEKRKQDFWEMIPEVSKYYGK